MPVIDVEVARAWAKERWPSPVVRRCVDFLLTNCPRAKELPAICCKDCKHSIPFDPWDDDNVLYLCKLNQGEGLPRTVYFDSTCDDAEEREETP